MSTGWARQPSPWALASATGTLLGVIFGNVHSAAAAPAAPATPAAHRYEGSAQIGGSLFGSVPYVDYQNSSYIDESRLAQMLNLFGLGAQVQSRSVMIRWLGQYRPETTLRVAGSAVRAAGSLVENGNVYTNLTAIAAHMHWALTYDAKHGVLRVQPLHASAGRQQARWRAAGERPAAMVAGKRTGRNAQSPGAEWAEFDGQSATVVSESGKWFVNVWYVIRALRCAGYQADFAHHRLVVPAMPQVVRTGGIAKGGTTVITTLVRYRGAWYGPLSAVIQGLGLSAGVDRKGDVRVAPLPPAHAGTGAMPPNGNFSLWVQGASSAASTAASTANAPTAATPTTAATDLAAFLESDGTVVTAQVPEGGGGIQVNLAGTSALFMGYESPTRGWIGGGALVGTGTNVLTLPTTTTEGVIAGRVHWRPGTVGGSVTVRNVATHALYTFAANGTGNYSGHLPYGVYEVWELRQAGQTLFVGSRFVVRNAKTTIGTVAWPVAAQGGVYVGRHCIVMAQNADVRNSTLLSIAHAFDRVYTADATLFGLTPVVPVSIQVFGSTNEFTQHFLDESYGTSVSGTYGADALGVTEGGQAIAVNASDWNSDDGVNVLAHELAHVLLADTYSTIPSWLNEGLAWEAGLHAQLGESPLRSLWDSLQDNLWQSPLQAAQSGTLLPLLTASPVASTYNVEAQDNYAVQQLLTQYGMTRIEAFLSAIPTHGEHSAFQRTFSETESAFAARVNADLRAQTTNPSAALEVQVVTGSVGSNQLFVSNPQGTTFVYTGVTADTAYRFELATDGQVAAPTGLTLIGTSVSPPDEHWDVGMQYGGIQSFFSLANQYGQGFLVATETFVGDSNTANTSIAVELPLHLQLVSVSASAQSQGATEKDVLSSA